MFRDYTSYNNVLLELQGTNANIANQTALVARIQRLITASSRMIDRVCLAPVGFFGGSAETRFYDILPTLNGPTRWAREIGIGEGGAYAEYGGPTLSVMGIATGEVPRILIDPMITIPSEVAVDATLDGTYTSVMTYLSDYDLYPQNAQIDGDPFREIRWLPATATVAFPIGQRTLRVKSVFGNQPLTQTTQTLAITGAPTGGTFTVSYSGQTTAAIAFNAQGRDVQKALAALSTVSTLSGNYQGTSQWTVSDGQLPTDTLTITVEDLAYTGITATPSFTGGTTPAITLGPLLYSGVAAHPTIEQATILQTIKWLKMPDAPFGQMGTSQMGYTKLKPDNEVMKILEDGHFVEHWLFV